jgi:hypothetical protein
MNDALSSDEIGAQQVELLPDRTVMSAFSSLGGFHLLDIGGDNNDGGDAGGGDGGAGGDGGSFNVVAGNVNLGNGDQYNSAGNGGDGGDGGDGGWAGDGGGNVD